MAFTTASGTPCCLARSWKLDAIHGHRALCSSLRLPQRGSGNRSRSRSPSVRLLATTPRCSNPIAPTSTHICRASSAIASVCSDGASIIPPSPAGRSRCRSRSTPRHQWQRGAPGVEVAGEHVRTARVADHAGQLGLVDAAMLVDVEQRFAEQLVAIVSAHAGTSGTAAGYRAAGRRGQPGAAGRCGLG